MPGLRGPRARRRSARHPVTEPRVLIYIDPPLGMIPSTCTGLRDGDVVRLRMNIPREGGGVHRHSLVVLAVEPGDVCSVALAEVLGVRLGPHCLTLQLAPVIQVCAVPEAVLNDWCRHGGTRGIQS